MKKGFSEKKLLENLRRPHPDSIQKIIVAVILIMINTRISQQKNPQKNPLKFCVIPYCN